MTQAGRLHRLHADARRRPRQPPAGRPLHLGGHARRGEPVDVPRPAHGAARAQHVAGQEDLLRRQHRRNRRHDHRRRLHDRLHPDARHEPRHGRRRRGRATTRRTSGRPGNVQGKPAGTPKIWAQVASEGSSAYPTQSRVMNMGTATPGCSRFGQTWATVPFQPNTNPDGTANPLAGKDDAILYGATVAGSGRPAARDARVHHLRPLLQRRRRSRSRRRCT